MTDLYPNIETFIKKHKANPINHSEVYLAYYLSNCWINQDRKTQDLLSSMCKYLPSIPLQFMKNLNKFAP